MTPPAPITFAVLGPPQGKARARVVNRHGKSNAFTPRRTEDYEATIAGQAQQAMAGCLPLDGPILITLAAEYPIPTTWAKWKQDAAIGGDLLPTVKPDLDNVVKAVKDALSGVCWRDDTQVVSAQTSKRYGVQPKLVVGVVPLPCLSAQTKRRPAA